MLATIERTEFRGSIPDKYDALLGDVLFRPYAADLVSRIPSLPHNAHVLEVACGTGALTKLLRQNLPHSAHLVATDISDSMIEHAQHLLEDDPSDHGFVPGYRGGGAVQDASSDGFVPSYRGGWASPASSTRSGGVDVQWSAQDASNLSFPDNYFDAVFCQFGAMFFDNKDKAFGEICRVLKRHGKFIFNVWDTLEHNDLAYLAQLTVGSFFRDDPPMYYLKPFGFNDHYEIRTALHHAGFTSVEISTVNKLCEASSAKQAAQGIIEGTPMITVLQERGTSDPSTIIAQLEDALAKRYGDHPMCCRMQALVCCAQKR